MGESRPVPGFAGYLATSEGEILSKKTGRPLRTQAHYRTGHLRVRLYSDRVKPVVRALKGSLIVSRHADVYVHVAVCMAWHGPKPFEGACVLHWDDDPLNNAPSNLRWGTHKENSADRLRNSMDSDGFDWGCGLWR